MKPLNTLDTTGANRQVVLVAEDEAIIGFELAESLRLEGFVVAGRLTPAPAQRRGSGRQVTSTEPISITLYGTDRVRRSLGTSGAVAFRLSCTAGTVGLKKPCPSSAMRRGW